MEVRTTGGCEAASGTTDRGSKRSGKIPIQLLLRSLDEDRSVRAKETASLPNRPSRSSSVANSPPPNASVRSLPTARASVPMHLLMDSGTCDYLLPPIRPDFGQSAPPTSATSLTFEDESERPWELSDLSRRPRAPRPSYSEEQKFFIMYTRITKDHSWPEIEDQFADIFGQRTKGGLTSVYYRVRKDWGLAEVLKSGPGSFQADCREVEKRAMNFSTEFLAQIGYLDPQHRR